MSATIKTADLDALDWDKGGGLLPAIVQDADTLQVLMLGYMSREAAEATLESGYATFFSRSKQRLWRKGETSGNGLKVVDVAVDCDRDTLLVAARPEGPACHLGTTSCFGADDAPGLGRLARLEQTIAARAGDGGEESYTARLLAGGPKRIAQKVGEEGVETALAVAAGEADEVAEEAADLIYHLLVALTARGVSLADALGVLEKRAG